MPTKAEALQYEAWLKTKITQAPDWVPAKKDARRLTDLIGTWHELHGSSLSAGANTHSRLLHLAKALGNPIASQFSARSFAEYRARRLEAKTTVDKRKISGISANNLNREHAYLRAVFNELKRLGHWKGVNPLSTLRQIKIKDRELSFLTFDQIGALLAELEKSENPDALLITKLCLATAARWSEIETMTISQLRNGQVHFARTKTGKNRAVPIGAALHQEVLTHHAKRNKTDRGNPRLFQTAYNDFRRTVDAIDLDLPRGQLTHVLRHTFASHFMMAGGNILTLQRILGHKNLTMTMRYAHLAPEHLQEATTLNPLARFAVDRQLKEIAA